MPAKPYIQLTLAQLRQLHDKRGGICLHCGAVKDSGVEPRGRGCPCTACGTKAVVSIDALLAKGCFEFVSREGTAVLNKSQIETYADLAAYLDPPASEDSR